MLQSIADKLKTHRWLAFSLLGVLALLFAVWGAYGVVDINFSSSNYGLKINGEEISADTLNNAWQQRQAQYTQQLHGAPLTDAQKTMLQSQLMDEYISQTLMRQRAQKAGFRASDADVLAAYQSEPAFQIDGKFDSRAARAALAQAGMTPGTYEADRRQALQTAQLSQGIEISDFLTPSELKRIYALENEQREVRFAMLPMSRYAAAAKTDDASIAAWYHSHQADYMSPESVDLQYAELRLDQVASQVNVTPAELQAYFDKTKSRYSQPEKRHAHHILIPIAEPKDAKADAAALATAKQVLAQLKAGKDFGQLAKKYSADPGSAAHGGDLGWAERSVYDPKFADALFGMKVGEISDPVKTQFGYHIIRLDGIQPAHIPSLDEVRAQVEAEYRRNQAAALFGDRQDQLQQALDNGSSDIPALAKQFNLSTGEIKDFTRSSGGAPLGSKPELISAVFSDDALTGGRISGPLALADDQVLIFKVLAHHLPAPQPIDSVRQEIVAAITKSEATRAAKAAADAAVKQLQGGASFDQVAKDLGVVAAPAAYIGRSDPQVPVQVRDAAFTAPQPQGKPVYRDLALDDGGAALVAVSAVKPGTLGTNSKNDEQLVDQYMQRDRDGELAAYLQELQRRSKIERNPSVFQ
jgi:peptidyl-prolyl cis-trans isomerase D